MKKNLKSFGVRKAYWLVDEAFNRRVGKTLKEAADEILGQLPSFVRIDRAAERGTFVFDGVTYPTDVLPLMRLAVLEKIEFFQQVHEASLPDSERLTVEQEVAEILELSMYDTTYDDDDIETIAFVGHLGDVVIESRESREVRLAAANAEEVSA